MHTNPVVKRRKLFNPDDMDMTMTPPPKTKTAIGNKRQSIAAIQITSAKKAKIMSPKTPYEKKVKSGRRTTMFFETPEEIMKRKRAIKLENRPKVMAKQPCLVYTNMHSADIAVVKEVSQNQETF